MPDLRDTILAEARARNGTPYGLPPGPGELDCSLFVVEVLKAAGIPLPTGVRTAEQIRQVCTPVDWPNVLPGDCLFFEGTYDAAPPSADGHIASHIGFSLGAGTKRMIDANEVHGVGETALSPWWQDHLFEARRPPGLATAATPAPPADPPSTSTLRGVDVSNHQGHIEWGQVASAGYAFCFVKATEGDGYLDPYLAFNWQQSRAAGLARGCYHYARPEEGNTAKSEATYFVNNVLRQGPLDVGDMLVLDLEPSDPVPNLGIWALDWLQEVEMRTGIHPIVYTGTWVAEQQRLASWPSLANYALWLAAYTAQMPAAPAPWSKISIWQHSDQGAVPGISGKVDLNLFGGSRQDLLALGKGAIVEEPTAYSVGTGLLALMAADGTEPAAPSTFLPLGQTPAILEEAYGMNGKRYVYRLPDGQHWRYSPDAA